jgi:hypothetical protein
MSGALNRTAAIMPDKATFTKDNSFEGDEPTGILKQQGTLPHLAQTKSFNPDSQSSSVKAAGTLDRVYSRLLENKKATDLQKLPTYLN